jgi:hypothetical protein
MNSDTLFLQNNHWLISVMEARFVLLYVLYRLFAGNTDYFYPSQGYCCINSAFCPPYIIQGDLRGNVNILGGVRISHCEKISSYEHVSNFKHLPS